MVRCCAHPNDQHVEAGCMICPDDRALHDYRSVSTIPRAIVHRLERAARAWFRFVAWATGI